ncbi:MAG: hypothetical protein PVF70_05190 [Anaerolineales bacterium]|jgi:hypothetical protein
MSILQRLPARNIERLSAYLDGALSKRQAERLEARMRIEPELREALDALRMTSQLLGNLPEIRPPRNFTLTPAMAGIRQRQPTYPVLRLATALAALAFLSVVGVDALVRNVGPLAALQDKGVQLEMEMAAAEEVAAPLEEDAIPQPAAMVGAAPEAEASEPPAPGDEFRGGEFEEPMDEVQSPALEGAEPTPVATDEGLGEGEEAPAIDLAEVTPTPTPVVLAEPDAEPLPSAEPVGASQQVLLVLLRVAEAAFGVAAVLLAVFMFRARRRSK